MKSLDQLEAIRKKVKKQMHIRYGNEETIRVVVGMATCGIAAGARPVMTAFLKEVEKNELPNVIISQTSLIDAPELEPVVEVFLPGEEKVTYVHMTPDKVPAVVQQHLVNHTIVTEYTLGDNQ